MQDLIEKNALAADEYDSDRRGFLKAGLFAAAALGFWTPALAEAAAPRTARLIYLQNPYTGEKFTGEYWYNGRYIPSAFVDIKKLMRDHRVNEQFPIDPRLMDILYVMNNRLGVKNSYHVLSGYRSPATNARLRRNSEGVARNSLHMTGQAVDIRLPGTRLNVLRKAAMDLKSGGVGFYPRSDFVHVDTGRVRHW